jgi:C-terminal processing protease CtpA/Prc
MFSLVVLFAITSVASTTNGKTQNGGEGNRPRRARAGGIEGNFFERGSYIGISLDEVNAETAQRLKLREERGALVSDVVAGGPAAQAGLKKDDVIVRWNGQPVDSASQLMRHRQETPAGRTVRLSILRDGRDMELDLKLGDRAESFEPFRVVTPREGGAQDMFFSFSDRGRLGASLQSLTPQLAEFFGLSGRKGVLVSSVEENSAAAKAGLQAGDIILSIGGEDIDNPMEIGRELRKRDEGPVDLKILRNRQERSLTVQLEKRQGAALTYPVENIDELIALPMDLSFDMPLVNLPDLSLPLFEMKDLNIPLVNLPELDLLDVNPDVLSMPKIVIPKNLKRQRVHL